MANNYKQQFFYSYTKGLVALQGPISLASGTVGVSSSSINGASAARTGVGEITITFQDVFQALVYAGAQVLSATARDLVPQIKSVSIANKQVVINLLTGATPTDPANAMVLYINLFFRNSSINP